MTTNLTNQDNVGNYYFGFRTNDQVFSSQQIGLSYSTLVSWINTSFGETCATWNNSNPNSFFLILPHPDEVLTRPAITAGVASLFSGSKFRFSNQTINPRNTNGTNGIYENTVFYANPAEFNSPLGLRLGENLVYYCVLNNSSLNIFACVYSGDSLNPNAYFFRSIGFVKEPLYSGIAFPRNAYYYFLDSNQTFLSAGRPELENTSIRKRIRLPVPGTADPIANYAISCQMATPGANATNLVLRDHDAPNKAIGIVPNLLKTTLNIPVGQIYRNSGIDPDGSDNPHSICVGKIGNESILMRVWATGLV
jgi:hypothetical protein